jgi:hypothetical protein
VWVVNFKTLALKHPQCLVPGPLRGCSNTHGGHCLLLLEEIVSSPVCAILWLLLVLPFSLLNAVLGMLLL